MRGMSWWNTAPLRLAVTTAGIALGAAISWPTWAWAGAGAGYLAVHTGGWALDRLRNTRHPAIPGPRRIPATPRGSAPPARQARKYRMRITTLSGTLVAGAGFGLLGMLAIAGTFGLIGNAVARRFAAGAPLLFSAGLLLLVLGGGVGIRRAVLSDVEIILGAETMVLRARRRKQPWQELRLPLASIRYVTCFADPFGPGRWLRVNAGAAGRCELRASGLLAGKRAQAAIDCLAADLLHRLGASEGHRPYLARWGTLHYPAPCLPLPGTPKQPSDTTLTSLIAEE